MKRLSKLSKFVCTVLLLAGQANLFTGCNDDMPAESYYTFTGEMMSDFLIEHENFCLFKRIAERAGKMDFLGSRGSRTFFPATNAGVEAFLKEKDMHLWKTSRFILRYAVEGVHHRKNHVHLRLARNATGKQRTGLTTHLRKQGRYVGCQPNGLGHRQPPGRHHQTN